LENTENRVYTTQDIAGTCGVSPNAVRKWIYTGKVKDVKLKDKQGKRIFTQQDFDRFLAYARSREAKEGQLTHD